MAIVSIERAIEMYGYSENHLYVLISSNKRRNIPSPWALNIDGKLFIDTDEYERNNNIQQKCQDYNTTFLYWLMIQIFGSESAIADYMASKSHRFNTKTSWVSFIRDTMWYQAYSIQSTLRYTMQVDFTLISSKLVYNEIKSGRKFIDEWEE